MNFTALLTVPNKNNSNIIYTSNGTKSFEVEIEGTKILVHSFEGAGAALGVSEDSIKNALGQTLNNDKRIDWTRHTWAGVSGAVSDICDKHSACLGCGHYDTVVLVGHSYGGHAAMKCVEELHDETIQMWDKTEPFCLRAALVFTIDPVKHLTLPPRPDQVGDWGFSKDTRITGSHINYYQRCDVNSFAGAMAIYGDSVNGADNTGQEVTQDRFDNSGKSHINIVQTVAGEFAAALQNVPTQQSSPGISPDHQ